MTIEITETVFDSASIDERTEWACRELWLNTPDGFGKGRHMDFSDWIAAGKPKGETPGIAFHDWLGWNP